VNNKRTSRAQTAAIPQGEVIAEFKTHAEAAELVTRLIDGKFPAGSIAVVGKDLRTVERVRGKLSNARVALGGATTGSWLGLIWGLIFGASAETTTTQEAFAPVVSAIFIGAGIGMLINILRFAFAKNKPGFISQSTVVASKYQVQVPSQLADQAAAIMATKTI
jgi:hypothetical protein